MLARDALPQARVRSARNEERGRYDESQDGDARCDVALQRSVR
ncbi:hypothetical protein HNR47_003464 [Methylopila jiangsuensis]|nr:hypothetical protein [Methylopila jiangsuensis]MDR6287434.1 hypothetical protein [Methylopila jiangsuensis]